MYREIINILTIIKISLDILFLYVKKLLSYTNRDPYVRVLPM